MKPVILTASVAALVGLALWLAPGVSGLWGGGGSGQRGADAFTGDGSSAEAPLTGNRTRVRERPPEPTAAQRKLRVFRSWQSELKTSTTIDQAKLDEFRATLDDTETEELLAVLRELEASDASHADKVQLAGFIAGALSRRDPRLALDTFISRISTHPQGMLHSLGLTYGRWAASDPAAAAEWFEHQAASGALAPFATDGKMQVDPRIFFESLLLRAQAGQDPAAASARFAAMSEEAKVKLLSDDWFGRASPEKVKAVADFLRDHYEDSTTAISIATSERIRGGSLGDAAKFLDALDPTADERAAIVAEAVQARIKGREELRTSPEETRAWILQQAPQDADRLTGTMLAQMMEWHEFTEMSRLALQYCEESGSDEVLAAFLKSAPLSSREDMLLLAEKIADPAVREEVTARFAR